MKLSKVDLSSVVAIAHDDEYLGLVIDRGESLEVVEIPAPIQAYEGLQLLNEIASSEQTVSISLLPPAPISLTPVQSTMAKAIGYDATRQVLQIEFNNGSVYEYDNVDDRTWHDLRNSDSPGRVFNHEIKGNYRSRRVI